jgi:thiamine-monophosphate kinase
MALREQALDVQRLCTLSGGDDYELVFTASPADAAHVAQAARSAGVGATRIGRIEAAAGLRLADAAGREMAHTVASFDHFRA